ncbi:universal stress protein [Burkholderia glumae]|uniref:universal stress protein n=1 Tax=Burkholderia glumae TaxID=337 RepID=UPI0021503DFF|nr:universal stress protein [Burkholderia glumae]
MFSRILVALDGSRTAWHALDAALAIAAEHAATLDTLYVIDFPVAALDLSGAYLSNFLDAAREQGRQLCTDAAGRMASRDVKGTQRVVEAGSIGEDVADTVARAARAWPADLLVMGTHGRRGWRHLMLGSVAERTLRLATCPVLLIPTHTSLAQPGEAPADPAEAAGSSHRAAPPAADLPDTAKASS